MVTLNELIQQGEDFTQQITFVPSHSNVIRLYSVYKIEGKDKYENWKAVTKRYINVNHPNDKSILEFEKLSSEDISPNNHLKMLAILKALNIIPQSNISSNNTNEKGKGIIINNNIHQSQSQTQEIMYKIFIECIKDELTGKQLKDIEKIVEEYRETPEIAKPTIINKLKSFGENVLSNILANIITNPNIYDGFIG